VCIWIACFYHKLMLSQFYIPVHVYSTDRKNSLAEWLIDWLTWIYTSVSVRYVAAVVFEIMREISYKYCTFSGMLLRMAGPVTYGAVLSNRFSTAVQSKVLLFAAFGTRPAAKAMVLLVLWQLLSLLPCQTSRPLFWIRVPSVWSVVNVFLNSKNFFTARCT